MCVCMCVCVCHNNETKKNRLENKLQFLNFFFIDCLSPYKMNTMLTFVLLHAVTYCFTFTREFLQIWDTTIFPALVFCIRVSFLIVRRFVPIRYAIRAFAELYAQWATQLRGRKSNPFTNERKLLQCRLIFHFHCF